jgi:hypothetical protein
MLVLAGEHAQSDGQFYHVRGQVQSRLVIHLEQKLGPDTYKRVVRMAEAARAFMLIALLIN